MTIKSMTGFARQDGVHEGLHWAWEVRSVNGRGLDIRLRLPPGLEAIETRARDIVAKSCTRGSINITLAAKRDAAASEVRLNETVLVQVLAAAERVARMTSAAPARIDGLLALKGVLETVEGEEDERAIEGRNDVLLAGLGQAVAGMVAARVAEGARLVPVLEDQLTGIERLVAAVAASPARTPEAIRARIAEQLKRIADTGSTLDADRLYQEAALIATRGDVEEELKRLTAHVAGARALIAAREPAGRKLDFLAQEFNREANTLCSKAGDVEITRHGLDLKAIIDQMREQVQNIE